MSIPFSYFTTTAWEKFVEKHDDFMRNSKTKIDNKKQNTKLYFRIKWWFWKEFGLFRSRSTHSCLWPFSFYSFLLPPELRPPTRSESACLYIVGGASLDFTMAEGSISWCGAWSLAASLLRTFMDLLSTIKILPVRDLSGHLRSFIAFTLSASVEGGCKRIGRIPGVMRSHSW